MRPASLALMLLVLAGVAAGYVTWVRATAESRDWATVTQYEGRNLRQTNPIPLLRFPDPTGVHGGWFYRPWRLVVLDRDTPAEAALLLCLNPGTPVSENNELHAAFLSRDGRRRWETTILGGIGFVEGEAAVFRRAGDPSAYVRLRPRPSPAPDGVADRFYAVSAGDLRLVRLEDAKGAFLRNRRDDPRLSIGPLRSPRLNEQFLLALTDPTASPVLQALCELAGVVPPEPQAAYSWISARNDPNIRARILELRGSPDPWIREAAEAVPLDGSP